jgi:hypothetical protein
MTRRLRVSEDAHGAMPACLAFSGSRILVQRPRECFRVGEGVARAYDPAVDSEAVDTGQLQSVDRVEKLLSGRMDRRGCRGAVESQDRTGHGNEHGEQDGHEQCVAQRSARAVVRHRREPMLPSFTGAAARATDFCRRCSGAMDVESTEFAEDLVQFRLAGRRSDLCEQAFHLARRRVVRTRGRRGRRSRVVWIRLPATPCSDGGEKHERDCEGLATHRVEYPPERVS